MLLSHYGFRARDPIVYQYHSSFLNNDVTPSVKLGNVFLCASSHSSARSITNFDDGFDCQVIIIKGANPTYKTTLSDGTYLKLNGDWVESLNNTISLININNIWYELFRSANG